MPATHPYLPRVALIFDFDRTLASDTIDGMCREWGLSRAEWEDRYEKPLGDNWDGILKRGQACIDCARDRGEPLTREFFSRAACRLDIYPGVEQLRERLAEVTAGIDEEIEIELVVLSSGFTEMIEDTAVEKWFDRTWAGSFHFGPDGHAQCMKRIISHPAKALYIEAYAKGLDLDHANEPETDDPDFEEADMHVPFDQIIYVGDGASDLDSFGFVANRGGVAIAIDKSASFDHVEEQTSDERVDDIAAPDYSEGSELLDALRHAVRSAASRAAIRKLARSA
jgi:phosphoserine phosphatase